MTDKLFPPDVIDFAQEIEAEAERFSYRLDSMPEDEDRARDDYDRDYARILYSSSFRRLQGKMQLLGVDHTSFHRNRLTHSLEVAQIARTIANGLELNHPVVSDACSLAHDLGNPPFGHAGERILNELADDIGGFEGNAQVIRILRHIEKKFPCHHGLNLTVRTLLGVAKYFYRRKENRDKPNKFLYDEDYIVLDNEWKEKGVKNRKSIDAQIVDLADEIAYGAHDLEDALSMGHFTLDDIVYEFKISEDYSKASNAFEGFVKDAQDYAERACKLQSSEEYSAVLRKELTSIIINRLVRDIQVVEKQGVNSLDFGCYKNLSRGLKKLVYKTLLRKTHIQLYEKRGESMIRGLYQVYTDEKFNKEGELLPVEFRGFSSECEMRRNVIDYIAGMMDSFAIKEYEKYYGANALDGVYVAPPKAEESEAGK